MRKVSSCCAPYEARGGRAHHQARTHPCAHSLVASKGYRKCMDCNADAPKARGLNDIIACIGRARRHRGRVHPAFAGLGLELTHIGSEDIHATDRGHKVIADAFAAALKRDVS